jgi:HK97 family phage major capsid protein
MTVELKDIEDVAKGIQATFDEFKSANDKHLDAIKAEKGVLSGKVDVLNEKLSEFESVKTQLETLQKQQNRPGSTDAAKAAYSKGFVNFMRKGDASEIEHKDVNLGSNADGGFAVPEELDRAILELERDISPMRQVCNSITVGTEDYKKLVNLGGAASGWVGETAERPKTDSPTLAQIAANMGEIYANPAATQRSLDDIYFDAEAWLQSEVAIEFNDKEGLAFLSGNGTNKPKGILAYTLAETADAGRAFGTLQKQVAASTTAVTGDELIDLIHSLKAGYRLGSSFMMNTLKVAQLRKLKNTEGDYIYSPSLEAGTRSSILGYSITENEDMPASGANSNSILFGNFNRGYTIVDRMGTRILRDPFTNKPYIHFYTTRRTGGMLTDSNAIKVLSQAAS